MRPRVIVVGGGLAGLAAAVTCADAKADVTLLEARPRLGGAARSFERQGRTVDTGQHVFLRCCRAYRGFLTRLGTLGHTRLQRRLDVTVLAPGGGRAHLTRSNLPAPLHLAGSLARYGLLRPRERLRAARAARALARLDPTDPALDERTFGSWLAEHGQSPRAIAVLWDLIARPALNVPAGEASLALAVKVFRTGLLDAAGAGDLGLPAVPLSRLHAEPARRALEDAGAEVRLNTRAVTVRRRGPGLAVSTDPGQTLTGQAVVVAVPHGAAAGLLPEGAVAHLDRLHELGTSPIVNVHVRYDRRVTSLDLAAAVDSPVQWMFDRTAATGWSQGQYLVVSLSAASRWITRRAGELGKTFTAALAELLPRAGEAEVADLFVTREPTATFRQTPGTARLRPGPRTRVPGLYLAGAWTDTGWPATMEGAVRSGLAAARVALEDLTDTAEVAA